MNEIKADALYARRYSVLAAIMLGNIMGPIDASIVNVVLPTIAQSFHAGISMAQWVPMVYLLTISSMLLFYGRLGDVMGYKRVYLCGLAGFITASGLCGLASSIGWLILFRAVQGLGAGMTAAVSIAIITGCFPASDRGKALGIHAISISAGLAIGPSLGGFITSLSGWRLVFLINIPIGIAALLWGYRVIPGLKGQPGKIDVPGVVTIFISLSTLLLFFNRYPRAGFTPETGLLLLIAVFSGAAFLWIERRVAQPLLNLSLFRNATFSFANISAFLNFVSQYVLVFLTPFYLQRVLHYPPKHVGLIMTAFPLAVMLIAPISGSLSDKVGTRMLACLGTGTCAAALFLLSPLSASASPADIMWRLALFGLGTGMFQSPNNSAIMGSVPRPHLGIASGILATMRTIGMVLGIATGGAVLYAYAPPQLLEKATLDGLQAAAFVSGLSHAYLTGGILAAAASLTSLVRSNGQSRGPTVVDPGRGSNP